MIVFVLAVVLLLTALLAVTLEKVYFYLPAKELKRRTQRGDHVSAVLVQATAYGSALHVLLGVVIILSASLGIVLFAQVAPILLGVVVVVIALTLAFFWQPRTRLTYYEARLAVWCTPAVIWLMRYLQPYLQSVANHPFSRHFHHKHTGLYEQEDLLELLERQRHQRDSRINPAELERLQSLAGFSTQTVRDAYVPRKKVRSVDAADTLSPVLINELHEAGHPRFPVYDGEQTHIIGTLSIDAIADVKQHGAVGNNIDRRLAYVHEHDTLEQVIRAYYETRQHLFIVLDAHGKYTGIITLTDVLQKLFGGLQHAAFGKHEDHDAVTSRHGVSEKVS